MTDDKPFGLGLLGAGAFGRFCLRAYTRLDGVRPVAAARARSDAARQLCDEMGLAVHDDYQAVIDRAEVHVVHVATPPDRHHDLALAALRAGKHVLLEKPPALTIEQAEELVDAAAKAQRFCAVNFVLRYSPVTEAVRRLLAAGPLGAPLAARVTNLGSDSGLGADHWFWNPDASGGIFIEHGVHFFDLYAAWLGPGEIVEAHELTRNGELADRVACTVRHAPPEAPPVLVEHYHGFDQIGPMDRTEHRIVCEMGDVRVAGWLPAAVTVDAAVDDAGAETLAAACPDATIETVDGAPGLAAHAGGLDIRGRGVMRHVTRRIRLHWAPSDAKEALYAEALRALLRDQLAWARGSSHERTVTEHNGPAAMACAVAAREAAGA
ncbi:MAG: Gfo/Idh/MocA family oxidoreductase [Phycisphaerae bacterium]|nr:Gfo/Idh/MocA family oxidoreductase [Phycisphaerae bacterium]